MQKNITKRNMLYWDERAQSHDFYSAGARISKDDPLGLAKAKYRTRTEYRHVRRMIDLKNKSLLDLGCGTGRLSFQFAKECRRVVGIDFSERLIGMAKAHAQENRVQNIEFLVSDLQSINLQEKFDIIYFGGVLMCIDDTDVKKILTRIESVLKPDSIVINRDSISLTVRFSTDHLQGREDYTVYRTAAEYQDLFKETYNTFYISETYPFVLSFNIYNRLPDKLKKNRCILFALTIGLYLQSALLDPWLLKHKRLYRKQSRQWQTRQYYFFHKLK